MTFRLRCALANISRIICCSRRRPGGVRSRQDLRDASAREREGKKVVAYAYATERKTGFAGNMFCIFRSAPSWHQCLAMDEESSRQSEVLRKEPFFYRQ